jgi:membrane-bound metal-dependent hydrolase YbcI (DUF457 family)
MDPISHVIFGRTLVGALDTDARSRFSTRAWAAAALGALSPDVDAVLMPRGWDIYLRAHEAGTHSILGALILGSAAGALVRLCSRGRPIGGLVAAGAVGALSHLAMDVLSGAQVRLFWPLVDRRFSLPLVAMADLWLIVVLTCVAIALWVFRRTMQRAAIVSLVCLAAFFGVKAFFYTRVLRTLASHDAAGTASVRVAEARWGSWTEWFVFERQPDALRAWLVDARGRTMTSVMTWPVSADPGLVAASRRLQTVTNFLAVHNLTFAVERLSTDGATEVLWSDIRYCAQSQPGSAEIQCGLWFGGDFDDRGQPIRQIVRLGDFTQERPVLP